MGAHSVARIVLIPPPMMSRQEPLNRHAREMKQEHLTLALRCDDIIKRAESGDWRECDGAWDAFQSALTAHMDYEDSLLVPAYAAAVDGRARVSERLRRDHAAIRAEVDRLGVAIQLHTVREDDIRALVAMLAEHAAFEGRVFYPWIEALEPIESTA
jgi:hypothetical protein